jgi:hypothetical protein
MTPVFCQASDMSECDKAQDDFDATFKSWFYESWSRVTLPSIRQTGLEKCGCPETVSAVLGLGHVLSGDHTLGMKPQHMHSFRKMQMYYNAKG